MNLLQNIQTPEFQTIIKVVEEFGKPTYIIGGFVRDILLERNQKKDIDIVTEGDGIELAHLIAAAFNPKIKVNFYKNYGTAAFNYKDVEYELVGARKESYTENSRNPEVEKGSISDDQNRRDFTINALAISLNPENLGELIDPFGGISDLENKILKTPLEPSITFSDDPLRMMRAIRFAAQLHFKIEEKTFKAIQENAERLHIVSMERIMVEFNKIMQTPQPGIGLHLLNKAQLLGQILPEITDLQGIDEIEGQTHKDNFYHTLEVVDNLAKTSENLWLRWSALLHDIGKARTKKFVKGIGWTFHSHEFVGAKMAKKIFKRLKLPLHQEMNYVAKMVFLSSRPIPLVDNEVTDSALRRLLFDAGNELEDLFLLCKADITTKNEKKQKKYKRNFELVEKKIKEVEEKDKIRNFQPPVSGEEIMKTFNIKPGREIGIIKEAIKEAILEGKIENEHKSAHLFMINLGKKLNLTPNSSISHDIQS